jgi:hypothetical protein
MPRASVVVRPGWNEAAHTDAELLHAAAYYEFKTHVEGLLQRGLVAEATRLWASVCQIDHFPPHPLGLGVQGLPPFRRSPCMEENCRRCTEYLGGFKFPWIGTWNSSAVLALPGSDPRLAWQSYYDRLGEAKLDLLLIEPLRTHWTARDFAPDNIFGLVAFIEHNAESMVDLAELWDVWRTWQSPRRGWRDPSMVPIPADLVAWRAPRARAVRSLWGWLGAMEAGEEPLPPCKACGLPTPELCERCFSSVCSTCPPSQCPGCHPVLRRDPSAAAAA